MIALRRRLTISYTVLVGSFIGLVAAAAAWLASGPGRPAPLDAASFVLPLLAPRLARIRAEVLRGRGFVLLRGLPVRRWPERLSELAFIGLGAHLGAALSQNAQGDLLGHVRDLGLRSSDPQVRIYQTLHVLSDQIGFEIHERSKTLCAQVGHGQRVRDEGDREDGPDAFPEVGDRVDGQADPVDGD